MTAQHDLQLLTKIQSETEKAKTLLEQRSYLQYQRKQVRIQIVDMQKLDSGRSIGVYVVQPMIHAAHPTQANMDASFARQNLMAKVSQLKATKNWSDISTPDGRVNIDTLMRR
jgi:hypothetical protein